MKVCPTCNRLYHSGVAVCARDGSLLGVLREWRPGDSVSEKFRILEKIGHGSIGPAFRAKVLPFGGIRVLKSLTVHLADDEDLLEVFGREIRKASALRHINVAHLESLERSTDGRPFIVMEYVPGLSLRELLVRGGYVPAMDVVDIMRQVCTALDCAHWQGVLHRNIKPDNVIIAEEHDGAPRVKVLEFGMANLREAAAERGKHVGDVVPTGQGRTVGTAEYMSPEQATGAPLNPLDGRSDLYSVGVMMFEAMTGDLPSSVEDPMSLLKQKQEAASNELLCGTVLKALQQDPDYRFQSATEMITALREVSLSLGKGPSVKVAADTEAEAVKVALASQASEQLTAEVPQHPPLWPVAPSVEDVGSPPPSPRQGFQPPGQRTPRKTPASTDRDFDQIRRAYIRAAGPAKARRTAQGSLARISLFVLGGLVIGSLAAWVVYQRPGFLWGPQKDRGIGFPANTVPLQAPAQNEASALGVRSLADEPPSGNQPATINDQDPDFLPGATGRPQAFQGSSSTGGQLDTRAGGAATDATAARAGRRAAASSESVRPRAGAQTTLSREAEIRGKMAMGWFYVEQKDYQSAVERFSEVLKIDPSNIEAEAALRLARFASQNPNVNVLPSTPPAADDAGGER